MGEHPWCVQRRSSSTWPGPKPSAIARRSPYEDAVAEACASAEAAAKAGVAFPDYLTAMFDYAAEDAFLSARGL